MNALMNIVRIGIVSSIDSEEQTARVTFQDKENLVSGPLKVLENTPNLTIQTAEGHDHEIIVKPWMPSVGQSVVCLYLPNGESDGFVLGKI